ncbi:hypothetical protein ACA910_010497 [Epithemia clementina (nom. ined.)]
MDLNPTYGAQELLENLSHGSGKKSPSSGSASKNKSSSSNTNSSSKSGNRGDGSYGGGGGGNKGFGPLSSSLGGSGSAHVDEAYRRLGQRLSLQAHGDILPREPPPIVTIEATNYGAFRPYNNEKAADAEKMDMEQQSQPQDLGSNSSSIPEDQVARFCENPQPSGRSMKVAKTRYSDHGDHTKRIRSESLLRKLTYEAKHTFRQWEQAMTMQQHHHKKPEAAASMDAKLSPQRYAFSQLSIEGGGGGSSMASSDSGNMAARQNRHAPPRSTGEQLGLAWADRSSHHQLHHHLRIGGGGGGSGAMGMGKGLLSAVLEVHSDSNTSASGPVAAERSTNRNSPGSQSISTKGSIAVSSHGANSNGNGNGSHYGNGNGSIHSGAPVGAAAATVIARGKCLTNPSQPVTNDGHDNVDGNLIVHENDLIVVPRKGMHSIKPNNTHPTRRASEFRVQSLLGQGTFAQVFQCLLATTGETVAVKIVKNKPAYTRQATIEIDVFRALVQQQQHDDESKQRSGSSVVSGTTGAATTTSGSSGGSSSRSGGTQQKDYMVNLICYFMYRSHLCLVFELLGLNLYEVLKRRQFRGLPLTVVRSIVLQSVEGVKELSQKGIVHCDLKPENILFASDEAVREVVNAGETTISQNHRNSNKGEGAAMMASQQFMKKQPPSNTTAAADASGGSDESRGNSVEGDQSSGSSSNAQTIQMGNVANSICGPSRSTKLIDFGSACFEGHTAHTYIQSRFYRSPEVLIGLPYDSAIDMWSLGCVTAELFLGLPILPGVHEHDQLCRITEMIAKIPDWMLDQGSKASKFFIKFVTRPASGKSPETSTSDDGSSGGSGQSPKLGPSSRASPAPPQTQWRLKTLREYIVSLSQNDINKKGGLAKLETQPGNRYFRRTRLPDILTLHAQNLQGEERELVPAFIHFLYGLLDPDPWKRWTAFQAMQHPFLTGALHQLRRKTERDKFDPKDTNHANLHLEFYWKPPWDPAICRRKLLNVQKMREKQQAMRRSLASTRPTTPRGSAQRLGSVSPNMTSGPPTQVSQDQSVDSRQSAQQHKQGLMFSQRITASSSSLSDLGNPGYQAQIALGSPATTSGAFHNMDYQTETGARSFNSAGYIPGTGVVNQGDLGIALQRPGVVPAAGGDSVQSHYSSYSCNQSTGSNSYVFDQSIPHSVYHQKQEPMNLPGSLPQVGPTFPQPMITSAYGSADHINPMFSHSQFSGLGGTSVDAEMQGRQFQPTPSSAASSVTMEGQGLFAPHLAPTNLQAQQTYFQQQGYMQAPQQPFQQSYDRQIGEPHSQQLPQLFTGMQPQQVDFAQLSALQQQATFQSQFSSFQQTSGQPQQQTGQRQQSQPLSHQQQYSIPQQPVILAQSNAPGGGFYYVATSATGQPIILQPVGLLNQQTPGQPQQYSDSSMQFQQAQMMMQGQPQMMVPSQPFQQQPYGQQQFQQQQQQQQFMMGQQYIQQPQQQLTQQQQQPQQQQGGGRHGAQTHEQHNRRYQQSSRRSNQRNQRRPHYEGSGTSM